MAVCVAWVRSWKLELVRKNVWSECIHSVAIGRPCFRWWSFRSAKAHNDCVTRCHTGALLASAFSHISAWYFKLMVERRKRRVANFGEKKETRTHREGIRQADPNMELSSWFRSLLTTWYMLSRDNFRLPNAFNSTSSEWKETGWLKRLSLISELTSQYPLGKDAWVRYDGRSLAVHCHGKSVTELSIGSSPVECDSHWDSFASIDNRFCGCLAVVSLQINLKMLKCKLVKPSEMTPRQALYGKMWLRTIDFDFVEQTTKVVMITYDEKKEYG